MNLAQSARLRAENRCRKFSVYIMDCLATGVLLSAFRLPCKSWECKNCAPKKARQYGEKAHNGFIGKRVRFLTLTIRPVSSVSAGLVVLTSGWNRLLTNIRRKFGEVKFFRVLEMQPQTGMPHYHVLIDIYIPKTWLDEYVVKAGLGPVCDIRAVKSYDAFNYVVKYLRKGCTDEKFVSALLKNNTRRVSFSKQFVPAVSSVRHSAVHYIGQHGGSLANILRFIALYPTSPFAMSVLSLNSRNFVQRFVPDPNVLLLPAPE